MSIRYDPGFNKEIRRVVNNFNQKRDRAIKRGFKQIPPRLYVSELKNRYTNRNQLKSELARLENFNKGGDRALEMVENSGGAKAIEWEFDYLKQNQNKAIEFYQREYNRLSNLKDRFPGERQRLDTIKQKLSIAKLNIAYMNQDQFKSFRASVYGYLHQQTQNTKGYRGFMSAVEILMRTSGIPEKSINKFFDKFNVLTPDQFTYLYETNDLIGKLFDIIDSLGNGKYKFYATDEEIKEHVDSLLEQTDDMVKKAKERKLEDSIGIGEGLEEFNKQLRKELNTEPEFSRNMPVGEWMEKKREEYKNDPEKLKKFDEWMKMTE